MTASGLSKNQVDKLGERLKNNDEIAPDDMRMLDAYRRTFTPAYEEVVKKLAHLGLSPSGRQAKSTTAIVDKLRRESIRLTQVQDVAGCRVVVADIAAQEKAIEFIKFAFGLTEQAIKDRREMPSNGYRAVHIMVCVADNIVEIQVRTLLQDLWAQLSERTADKFGMGIKYGVGHPTAVEPLLQMSRMVQRIEQSELFINAMSQVRERLIKANRIMGDHAIEAFSAIVAGLDSAAHEVSSHIARIMVDKKIMQMRFEKMFDDLSTNVEDV